MNLPQLESFHHRILFPAYTLIVYADSELYCIHLSAELNYVNYPEDMKPCKWNAIIKNINLYLILCPLLAKIHAIRKVEVERGNRSRAVKVCDNRSSAVLYFGSLQSFSIAVHCVIDFAVPRAV